jgi:hypothetical protein
VEYISRGKKCGLLCIHVFELFAILYSLSLPDAIVGRNYPGEAIATAVLNCALCLSQLCVALTTPFLIAIAGGKVSAAFWPAGVATLVAAAVAFTMQDTAGQLQGPATTTTTTKKKPQKYRPVSSTER